MYPNIWIIIERCVCAEEKWIDNTLKHVQLQCRNNFVDFDNQAKWLYNCYLKFDKQCTLSLFCDMET